MSSSDIKSGGCMCGAVRFTATSAPDRVLNCHCKSCRHHTGAPMATLAVFTDDQVEFSGSDRTVFHSAPGVERTFCATCGSSLTWETDFGEEGHLCAIHISAFDDPDALPATGHSFYPERISWFDAHDDLPRYEAFVAGGILLGHGPADR